MNPWPISPLTQKDLDFAVLNYDFTTFTGNEQAELPGLETAVDLTLLDFAASIADQTLLITSLFDGLDDLGTIPGEIDFSDNIGNTLSDLSNAAAAADATLLDYTGQIGGSTGGGGTGGGGGGTTTCPTQDFGSVPTGTQKTLNISITNNSSVQLTIKSMQVVGNNVGNVFDYSPKYANRTIAPGAAVPLAIYALLQNATPQVYASTLTIFTDQPDPQPCMILKVTATQGGPPPGGGGGGGDSGGGCDVGFSDKGKLICLD